jgi:hypothetical protein
MTRRTAAQHLYYVTINRADSNQRPHLKIFMGGKELQNVSLTRGMLLKLIKDIAEVLD